MRQVQTIGLLIDFVSAVQISNTYAMLAYTTKCFDHSDAPWFVFYFLKVLSNYLEGIDRLDQMYIWSAPTQLVKIKYVYTYIFQLWT